MTEKVKRPATTISRKKYEDLQEDRDFQRQLYEGERKAKQKAQEERDAAQTHAADMEKMSFHHQQRANEAEVRASRAEGYASALLDKLYAPRPELPWERPSRVDQWGDIIQ